ncbi:MAG: segregation/condensation protein A [Phycisphaerales bacterium]|nr:MAG: segregation/condensation protein A [Phycisphaerales bacterium]
MSEYRVALDVYNGPLDLLLFLIRRDEIDIYDIPIARITEQYLQYVDVLQQLDPEIVSEFLVLAATLMEIKSRVLLPRPPAEEEDEEIVDPRLELVRQLLEYKKYKDAAYSLDDSARRHARQFPRFPVLPPEPEDETELEDLEIWDLFDAFNKLLEETGQRETPHTVGVDDTPIALHAEDILDSLERAGGKQNFEEIFAGRAKAEMIGLFLALLELIRQKRIRVWQDRAFGSIVIHLLDRTPLRNIGEVNGEEAERAEYAGDYVDEETDDAAESGATEDAAGIDEADGLLSDPEMEPAGPVVDPPLTSSDESSDPSSHTHSDLLESTDEVEQVVDLPVPFNSEDHDSEADTPDDLGIETEKSNETE